MRPSPAEWSRQQAHLKQLDVGEQRTKVVAEIQDLYRSIVRDSREETKQEDREIASEKVITRLQQVLGIQELTQLRQRVVTEAVKSITAEVT